MKKFLFLIIIHLVFLGNANSISDKYLELGAMECGEILDNKDKEVMKDYVIHWSNGFLTGINIGVAPLGKNIQGKNSRYYFITKYCEQNPLKDLTDATLNLYFDLKK